MDIPFLSALPAQELKGKRVLLRVDWNVPLDAGHITDDFRIRKTLSTMKFLQESGARTVIISHIGRDPRESLMPVFEYFTHEYGINFLEDPFASNTQDMIHKMDEGSFLLLENIRRFSEEKENDISFAEKLSQLADMYVNEAFSVSHRSHASIVSIPKFLPAYCGLQFEQEVKHLSLALKPQHPFVFIIGGAKMSTKIPLMKKFTLLADSVILGGAIANDALEEMGHEIGNSLSDTDEKSLDNIDKKEKLVIPTDVVVESASGEVRVAQFDDVLPDESIYDIGPKSISTIEHKIRDAKIVVWNGPLGYFEKGFSRATESILSVLADHDVISIVGGGDTVSVVDKMGIGDRLTFVSTGGGAMLDFLVDGTLPGIQAVIEKR